MANISYTTKSKVNVPVEYVFQFMAADDVLPRILIGTALLPKVIKTSGATGPWNKPGSQRTVHLAGGDTAIEQLTAFRDQEYFDYRVSNYTFALKYLAKFATGQWWFEKIDDKQTLVKWTYTFTTHSFLTIPMTWFFAKFLWRGYMVNAMEAMKVQLEEMQSYKTLPVIFSS